MLPLSRLRRREEVLMEKDASTGNALLWAGLPGALGAGIGASLKGRNAALGALVGTGLGAASGLIAGRLRDKYKVDPALQKKELVIRDSALKALRMARLGDSMDNKMDAYAHTALSKRDQLIKAYGKSNSPSERAAIHGAIAGLNHSLAKAKQLERAANLAENAGVAGFAVNRYRAMELANKKDELFS